MRKRWLVRKHVLYSIEKEFLGNSVPTEVPGREFEGSGDLSFMSFMSRFGLKTRVVLTMIVWLKLNFLMGPRVSLNNS